MNIKQLKRLETVSINLKNKISPSHKDSFDVYHATGRIEGAIEAALEIEKRRMLIEYLEKQPEGKRDNETLAKVKNELKLHQQRVHSAHEVEKKLIDIAVNYQIEEAARSASAINPGVVANFIRSTEEVIHEIDPDGDVTVFVGGQKVYDAVKTLAAKHDTRHLFDSSKASIKPGGGQVYNGRNPWMKSTFNLTEQGRIFKADPALAQRLKEAARN